MEVRLQVACFLIKAVCGIFFTSVCFKVKLTQSLLLSVLVSKLLSRFKVKLGLKCAFKTKLTVYYHSNKLIIKKT